MEFWGCAERGHGHWGCEERGAESAGHWGWREGQCLLLDTGDGAQ